MSKQIQASNRTLVTVCVFLSLVSLATCLTDGAAPSGGPDFDAISKGDASKLPITVSQPKTSKPRQRRPLSFLEMQPYLIAYSGALSIFAPLSMIYQLSKLHSEVSVSSKRMVVLSLAIVPHQTVLKMIQMNVATPLTKNLNCWAAFAAVGVLQGAVYGQANIFFAKSLKVAKAGTKLSIMGIFRGTGFAACRDLVSQGIPFVLAPVLRRSVFDRLWPQRSPRAKSVKKWAAVFSCSICATYSSQSLHNAQTTMQADQSLSYGGAVRDLWDRLGYALFYKGAEARVALNVVVNVLNQVLLKKAWMGVEVKESRVPDVQEVEAEMLEARREGECVTREECIAQCGKPKCFPPAA